VVEEQQGMSDRRAAYVGTLYAIQLQGEEPQDVERTVLGVDPEYGIVQAHTREDLKRAKYLDIPRGSKGKKCVRLWYERRRKEYPGDTYWYHDLADSSAFFVNGVDNRRDTNDRSEQVVPQVILEGPDVDICAATPGNFLCG